MRQVDIAIEKLANGGSGFGRYQGKACFVPFTAPGDVAAVRIMREKTSYTEAELVQLTAASSQRVKPVCPIFSLCGGCNWQHLEYQYQVQAKTEIFAELMWRNARVSSEKIAEVLPASAPFGYRSRIQLKVESRGGKTALGFFRPKSHHVIDIPGECAIAHKRINAMIEDLRRLLASCPYSVAINQIDLAMGDDLRTSAVFHYSGTAVTEAVKNLQSSAEANTSIDSLFIKQGKSSYKLFGVDYLSYAIRSSTSAKETEKRLFFSKDGFSQINYMQNQHLVHLVSRFAELGGHEKVLDLYCGNGNFSIPLADSAAEIVGFEGNATSIGDARKNVAYNGVANADYHQSDAFEAIKKLTARGETFDVVILDPPRNGAFDIVQHIPALQPERVIYVSCDPATLARDLNCLKQKGYEVNCCQGVDMFPQTYHLESVTLLSKS